MRTVILGTLAMAILAASLFADDPKKEDSKKLAWAKTYADGLKQAQDARKGILVFITDSSSASGAFQKKFFDDKGVIAEGDKLIFVRVDTKSKDKLLDKLQVKKGPEVRFFDYKENQLGNPHTAFKDAAELVEEINKAANYCDDMATAIEWQTNYDAALKQAKEKKLPVFIDYSSEG